MNNKFPKSFHHSHDEAAILERIQSQDRQSYLKDAVYGGIDGTVTTFAVVSGVIGAGLSHQTILILGAVNLLADGFSMAVGNYSATKTENEQSDLLRKFEEHHIQTDAEGERQEVRTILEEQGFSEDLLEKNIDFYTCDHKRWIDFMMTHEYGILEDKRSGRKAALYTFGAFALFGSLPLISFFLGLENAFIWSICLAALAFILVGSMKSRWTIETMFVSATKTLALGACASTIAYFAGKLVQTFL